MKKIILFVFACLLLGGCSQSFVKRSEALPPPTVSEGEINEEFYQELVSYNAYVDAELAYVATRLRKPVKEELRTATVTESIDEPGCEMVFELPEEKPMPKIPVVDPNDPDAIASALAHYITEIRKHRRDYQSQLQDNYRRYRSGCRSKKT